MKGSKERFLEEIPAKLRHLIADLIDMEQWTSLGASSRVRKIGRSLQIPNFRETSRARLISRQ